MKHIRAISGMPRKAATATTGSIVSILAQVITILGSFVTQKENSPDHGLLTPWPCAGTSAQARGLTRCRICVC